MKVILGFSLLCLITGSLVVAQKSDEATRKLWDTAYIAPAAGGKSTARRRSGRKYRIATPNVPIDNVLPESVVGVTIWRLRPAGRADSGERIIVHDDNAAKEYVPSASRQIRNSTPATACASASKLLETVTST